MPMDRSLYPPNWDEIALSVKERDKWKCQECSRECRKPGENPVEFLKRLHSSPCSELPAPDEFLFYPGRFVLTVAHLDQQPANCDRSNLRALCSVCHLRYDSQFRALQKRLKAERRGQLTLPL
jgi:5-methylcytosine-specific restriction endonuclease McrA